MKIVHILALGLAAALLALPATAEDCKPLARLVDVPIQRTQNGMILVPVQINGQNELMLLDTGGVFGFITPQAVSRLKLPVKGSHTEIMDVTGASAAEANGKNETMISQVASADTFSIGTMRWRGVDFYITNNDSQMGMVGHTPIAGILGPNLLKDYDIDLDLGHNRLSIMSPDHCPGRVIYWKAAAAAAVPIYLADDWHITIPVKLDGVSFNAAVDTGATQSTLDSDAAERNFSLKLGSPDTPQLGTLDGDNAAPYYRHRFHTLDFEGIAISNPALDLIPGTVNEQMRRSAQITGSRFSAVDEREFPDMLVGMDILSHLHVYIAYNEKMLYLTPAQ